VALLPCLCEVLSRGRPQDLFDAVLDRIPELLSPTQPLVVALDDTPCRKTRKRIRAAKILRDPLSPSFHTNLCHALRFLQAAMLVWPGERAGAARAIPVTFDLAPPVAKPKPPARTGLVPRIRRRPAPGAELSV